MDTNVSVGIYISGRSVHTRCLDAQVSFDENSVHNEITINFADPDLFSICDPAIEYGTERIEVKINSRTIPFLLETREGDRKRFAVHGRSRSALEDAPFAEDIDFKLAVPEHASSLAQRLATNVNVEWQATSWSVPTDFEFSGKPLDGIVQLAQEVGAIVRAKDDGNLLVRDRFPVVPILMDSTSASISYDRDFLLSLSHSIEPESGYNAVVVYGRAEDIQPPQLQLEETDPSPPIPGQEVFVKAYWSGKKEDIAQLFVTDGDIVDLGRSTETNEEDVTFIAGAASVSTAIYSLSSLSWYGIPGEGEITYEENGTDIRLMKTDEETGEKVIADVYGLAKVKYVSEYQRFRLFEHNINKLLAVLILASVPEVYVEVRTSSPAVYGDPIDAPLLTTEEAAVARGKAWLAKNMHRFSVLSISAPYDEVMDGKLVEINDDAIGEPGNYHIDSITIKIEKPKITNEMVVRKCLTSFL